MKEEFEFKTLEGRVIKLEEETQNLIYQDKILEEKIEGRLQIAEHTNIFLDVIFIVLSVILWAITMQGWRNSKDVERERNQLRDLLEKDRQEVEKYKQTLEQDRIKFENEYQKTIEETLKQINENKQKIAESYRVIEDQYKQVIGDIKGVSEYYLELVSISHEPDLADRVYEYERILKNSEKYHLSEEEKGRLYYYVSITLYQLAIKSPDVRDKIVFEWIKKASRYIASAITIGGKKGTYFYEKAKIELEKYRLELIQNKKFEHFAEKVYEIEEYFEIAFTTSDVEFYMFDEMILLLYEISEKLAERQSEKRVLYDLISVWCDRAKAFDSKEYGEDLEEIKQEITKKIEEQNLKLDN
jgi:phosphohistidine phosphatase SixA